MMKVASREGGLMPVGHVDLEKKVEKWIKLHEFVPRKLPAKVTYRAHTLYLPLPPPPPAARMLGLVARNESKQALL